MAAPSFNLNIKCIVKNISSKIIGNKAGYMKKLLLTSPFINKMKLLCIPHPGQSKCVTVLNIQGSWCASSQVAIFSKIFMLSRES